MPDKQLSSYIFFGHIKHFIASNFWNRVGIVEVQKVQYVRTFKAALMIDVGTEGGSEVKSEGVFIKCTSKLQPLHQKLGLPWGFDGFNVPICPSTGLVP